jgi:hypothetical protein
VRVFYDYPLAFRPLSRLANKGEWGVCGIQGILGVTPGGMYALCGIGEQIPELTFGVVGKDALSEVWKNASNIGRHPRRAARPPAGHLRHLPDETRLPGELPGAELLSHRQPVGAFLFCEQADQAGLFPASRKSL